MYPTLRSMPLWGSWTSHHRKSFYFQQQQFTFPVDTSMNVEIVGNKKALTTVRNKKKELKDLDNHAYQAGNETSSKCGGSLRQCR